MYGVTAAAILGLIFLTVTILFVQSTALTNLLLPVSTTQQYSGEELLAEADQQSELFDPLITVVPEDQQSAESKSTVFVSSLDPRIGPVDAKVFVILFGSFTDQIALDYITELQSLADTYGEDVAIVWKDYADNNDERAQQMSIVGHCVAEQYVPEAFWKYAKSLVSRTGDDDDTLFGLAEEAGAPRLTIQNCLETSGFQSVLDQGYFYGQNLGVVNGHTLYVNDRQFTDQLSPEALKQQVDEVLATFESEQ